MSEKLSPQQFEAVKITAAEPDECGPLVDALWDGILAISESESFQVPGGYGKGRSAAQYETTATSQAVTTVFTWYREDGTQLVRKVRVVVDESVDSHDDYWSQHSPYDPHSVRTPDGRHYVIGGSKPHDPPAFKGYGGHRWHVVFNDSRPDVYTDNLWSQCVIPPKHRERLFPNADLHSYMFKDCCSQEVHNW
jgi:hypothetical protein